MTALLSFHDVTKKFGGLAACSGVSLHLDEGELVGLIGPNGAGKTTVFNLLTGVYEPTDGAVTFAGIRLNGMKPHQVTSRGIARTFQNIRLFRELTVLQNVEVAASLRSETGLMSALFRTRRQQEDDRRVERRSRELLERLDLAHVAEARAGQLAYGLQRRLEIARALATQPRLLLLDEPAAGMNPQEKVALMDLIRSIRTEFNLTILLIEHDMRVVMGICERIYVLEYGEIIAEGRPDAIRRDPKVIAAYLGEEAASA